MAPFKNLVKKAGVQQLHAHNAWLDVWLQLGILGVVVFGALVLLTVYRAWRMATRTPSATARPADSATARPADSVTASPAAASALALLPDPAAGRAARAEPGGEPAARRVRLAAAGAAGRENREQNQQRLMP